jgi:hypothetical protein
MGRSQADVAVTALVAALACGAAASSAPAAAMTVLGIMLFAAPGYLLGQLLAGSRTTGLERVVVMAGLALAVPILGGLLLYAAGVSLHRPGWLGLLAGVTLAGDVALFLRRRVSGSGRAAPFSWQPAWRVPRWHTAAFAAAVLVAACGVGLARIGVAVQPQPGFTQLWLSPQHQNVHTLNLGVSNDQGSTTGYRLVLLRNGQVSATWKLTLANGQTWQRSVPFTGKYNLAANLYRLPDLTHPYRYVSTGSNKAAGS